MAHFGPTLGDDAWIHVPAWNAAALREETATGQRARRVVLATLGGLARGADVTDAADAALAMDSLRMMADATALDFVVPTTEPALLHRLGVACGGWASAPDATGHEPAWPSNIWPAVRVPTQADAPRIEALLEIPAAVRVVVADPMQGPITLARWLPVGGAKWRCSGCGVYVHAWAVKWSNDCPVCKRVGYLSGSHAANGRHQPIDWVIVRGDSGLHAHRFNVEWASNLVAECDAAGVPVFVDGLGSRPFVDSSRGAVLDMIFHAGDGAAVQRFPDPTHRSADDAE